MRSTSHLILWLVVITLTTLGVAQQSSTSVPNLISYSGTLKNLHGTALSSRTVGITFLIYRQEEGGAPLWLETQNVSVDGSGHYTVSLGSTKAEGLPADLFSAQEERWLAVQQEGQTEQPRVMLVSVPYAFKAHEAETLGGLPASAFVTQASQQASSSAASTAAATLSSGVQLDAARVGPATLGHGTKGYIPIWINPLYLSNSALFQDINKNVGIGTTTPAATLDVNGSVNSATGYQIGGTSVLLATPFLNSSGGNLFIGLGAGSGNTTGNENTVTGFNALYLNTTGDANTATGYNTLSSNATGAANTAVGDDALTNNISGFLNTATGYNALYSSTAGTGNTAVGAAALNSNTSGNENTAMGEQALSFNQFGYFNSALGYLAGPDVNSPALFNTTAIGANAVVSESNALVLGGTGANAVNVGIGTATPQYTLDVVGNAHISGSLSVGGSGIVTSFNGRIGAVVPTPNDYSFSQIAGTLPFSQLSGALGSSQLSGAYANPVTLNNPSNSFVGSFAGNGAGLTGVVAGAGSPYYIQNGTAEQTAANFNIDGNGTLGGFFLANAIQSNSVVRATTTFQIGGNIVLSGPGTANLFVGFNAGSNTTGSENTFSGFGAGFNNTTGSYNTFFGAYAGYFNTGGYDNTFIGRQAGFNNAAGYGNTFSGWQAGVANTTGFNNVFYGTAAGQSNTTGWENTIVGVYAGSQNNGTLNTFLGTLAGTQNTTGNNNIYIGNLGPISGTESNTIRIGGDIGLGLGQQTAAYILGIYGSSVGGSGIGVVVDSNGQLGTTVSSRRFKEQIRDMGDSTNALMKLRPVTFLYKPEYDKGPRTLQYGLIAEEVAEVYPDLVAYEPDGKPYTVKYQYLTTMLLNEMQKQYRRAEAQADVIKTQQEEIDDLKAQLRLQNAVLQERLSRLESIVERQTQAAVNLPQH